MNIKEELIRRYSYLYENKELILAMCINVVEIKPNERKQELEKLKREYKKLSADKMIINNVETTIKNVDGSTYEYYLFKDVSSEIVDLYEDFLLGNLPLEETGLYKHIEGVKNSPVYLEGFNNMINALEENRNKNMHLKNIPTFTVWKILSYVRRKNINNKLALEILDKYYNLDRYMLTRYNFQSGYYLMSEELNDDYKLPDTDINTGIIMFKYPGNKYEEEDNYYAEESLYDLPQEDYATSIFMLSAKNIPILDIEDKESLYKKYNYNKEKVLKREDNHEN